TPLALPESCTTSCGPSNLKTAWTGAMNGSLSSLTSPSPTWRPTLVSSLIRTKSAEVLPSRAIADSRALGFAGAAGLGGAGGGAPHERQEPTSVSLFAPQRGHSMGVLVFRAPREGQGYGKGVDVVVIVDGDGDVNVAMGDRRAASTATSPSPSPSTLTSTSTLT